MFEARQKSSWCRRLRLRDAFARFDSARKWAPRGQRPVKVLHVVTLVTPDGAFGGPIRVAINQASALRERGHVVQLTAGAIGYGSLPTTLDGVPAQLFDARMLLPNVGVATTWAPQMRPWIAGHAHKFDIAHIHLGRDLLTVSAALQLRRLGVPYVCQTHGMIRARSHPLAPVVDLIGVRRLLRDAAKVLYLDDRELRDLIDVVGADCRFEALPNGVPDNTEVAPTESVAPADHTPEVLFLSRLHARKRPDVFAQAALNLLRRGTRARFSIVGPAQGAERAVDAVIDDARRLDIDELQLHRSAGLPPGEVPARMRRAAVYVLPASREPFGLTIAEALAAGVPVVICDDGGLAGFVKQHRCGLCVDGSTESFERAISYLLDNPAVATAMGRRGQRAVSEFLSDHTVADRLEDIYRAVHT